MMFIFNCYFRTLEIVWVVVLRERDVYTHTHTHTEWLVLEEEMLHRIIFSY